MGCDIHTFVEQKKNNLWHKVSDDFGPSNPLYLPNASSNLFYYKQKNIWNVDRNYDLFAILAGVRGDYLDPISPPKGIPKDLSKEVEETYAAWKGSCHTPSWYLLSELLKAKSLCYYQTYWLDLNMWIRYKSGELNLAHELSNSYIEYEDHVKISNQEMNRIRDLSVMLGDKKYVTSVDVAYRYDSVSDLFWQEFVPAMEKLDSNPDNVRLVFWFDS